MTPRRLTAWTLSCLRPYRRRVALLGTLSVVEVALAALLPWPMQVVIDHVLQQTPWPPAVADLAARVWPASAGVALLLAVAIGVLIQLSHQAVAFWHTRVQVGIGQRLVHDLRRKLFEHLQALGLRHHLTTPTGDAVYRLEADAYSIENLVLSGLFPLVTAVLTLTVMLTILAWLDAPLALLSLAVVPPLYFCLRYYATRLVDRSESVKALESGFVERLYEVFAGMRLIKSYAREPYEVRQFGERSGAVMHARIDLTLREGWFSAIVGAITIVGASAVLVVGGQHVLAGRLTVGQLVVVIAYLHAVYGPLSTIAHTTGSLHGAIAGARRARDAFALEPEHADVPGAVEATNVRGAVRFDRVSFEYVPGQAVLRDITIEAAPGETIAIVGPSGAGKSTLASLIPAFFEPTHGRVLIDEIDVRQYARRSLRERIAVVSQEPMLIAGTIADNIRYGRLDASDRDVEAAARAAGAHGFISRLPAGYRTDVAEAGASLSGGERQRLNLARAFVKDAPLLILDEPTASLDTLSEQAILVALRSLRRGRTTFVIAHRLSTVREADRIVVLDEGRIVASGSHHDLLTQSPLYAQMCAQMNAHERPAAAPAALASA